MCVFFISNVVTQSSIDQSLSSELYLTEYLKIERNLIGLDGIFSVILSMVIVTNRQAIFHSMLLCCTVFIHIVVIYHLKEEHSWLSSIIYGYYDELIIITWLTMMAISHDGFTTSLREIRVLLLRANVRCVRYFQNLPIKQKDDRSP